ncbi:MAG: IS110 family transposase [Streptosporangiaceae bacterium]
MQYAPSVLPDEPVNGLTCGIDWARDDHAVAIVDCRGCEILRCSVEHSAIGLGELVAVLARTGVSEVAIERPDGPVVDALLDAGITVVVISPNQLKNLRSRYGSTGKKDDRFDAFVLADTLRTDRARLRPLVPNTAATVALRATCRARKDLVIHRVAVANQLREHLKLVFPGALGLFDELDSAISLKFLTRFDLQDRADWLTPIRLGAWLKSVRYTGRTDPATLHARLTAAPRGATGQDGDAHACITRALVATLTSLVEQIKVLSQQIEKQLAAHADAHIFTSLPRSGTIRAARLLAEIGDCRARFPTPEALICLAGVAPSTRQSGKMRTVGFRWACDKQLRDAVCDFANDSRQANPWAADLYNRARTRKHDHPHATRVLARAWLYVIWHCWQTNTAYDPAQHRALQAVLKQQQQPAA